MKFGGKGGDNKLHFHSGPFKTREEAEEIAQIHGPYVVSVIRKVVTEEKLKFDSRAIWEQC